MTDVYFRVLDILNSGPYELHIGWYNKQIKTPSLNLTETINIKNDDIKDYQEVYG